MIQVFPLVTPADRSTKITLRFDSDSPLSSSGLDLVIDYIGEDGRAARGGYLPAGQYDRIAPESIEWTSESALFPFFFHHEGEHHFFIRAAGEEIPLFSFNIYSLRSDLLALNPYKGDFHIHSNRSDGVDEPSYVAASCRRIGLDFMALTDHLLMEPSRDVMNWISQYETDLRCYPGEEVHPPDNPVHIINFGGKESVNRFIRDKEDQYRREVSQEQESIVLEDKDLAYQAASSRWVFKKIRGTGGLGMYCHPFWRWNERFYVSRPLHQHIMESTDFDLLETVSGFHPHELESNALSIALFEDEKARGKDIIPAGVSDAHGCDKELFGWYYTILFADSIDFCDLADSFHNGLSLAVSAVPGEFPRLIGPFRLVKFGYFLLREYFPLHDDLCRREGELLSRLSQSGAGPKSEEARKLAELKGRVPDLIDRLWQRD